MLRRLAGLLVIMAVRVSAQSTCPPVNFLSARTINLKPSATSHIDEVRQSDGSYTGFEVTDASPYRVIRTTPHFEQQFAACLPHTIPFPPSVVPPSANTAGAGAQLQVAAAVGPNYFAAHISDDKITIYFDVFDSQHNLISEKAFTSVVSPPGYVGSANESFESLALADLNSDGKLDLIAVLDTPLAQSIAYGGVWTFLGNGDGTFQTGNRQVLTSRPLLVAAMSIAIGDLNGDGKPDIVLAAPGASLNIFLGNGDGTFNTQTMLATVPTASQSQVSVALADLNGDGKLDLLVAPCATQNTSAIAIALGNGNGGFQTPILYPALLPSVSGASTAMVAAGDVNGDGIPDIVTAGGTILFGDGKGSVASRSDYASSAAGSVMLGDFDGDGKTDILFGNGNSSYFSGNTSDPSLTVMFGAGAGAYIGAPVSGIPLPTSAYTYGGPLPPAGEVLAAADFNGDGIPDMALVTFAQTSDNGGNVQLTTLQGRGNGQFSSGNTQTFAHAGAFLLESAAVGDFNHDGKPDLAVLLLVYPIGGQGEVGGEVQIYPGKGDGTFGAPSIVTLPNQNALYLSAPDLNGDGIPDLVVTSDESLLVLLSKGDGTFGAPVFSLNVIAPAVAFGDFNGDGKLDMVFAEEASTNVTVLLGKGDGTFSNAVLSALPGPALGFIHDIAVADFDGDGRLDLAVSLGLRFDNSAAQEIAVLSGKGDGTFPVSHVSPGPIAGFIAADVNGDKIPDLIGLTNPNLNLSFPGIIGTLSVRLGNGDGTFQAADAIAPSSLTFVVADINRDGSPDIAALDQGTGVVALLNLSQPQPPLTVVSAASFAAGPLAPNSIATAFGEGILPAGETVSGPLATSTTLAGVTVTVQDSTGAGRLATLYFASSNQVNFVVPFATAPGPATVTVNGAVSSNPLAAQVQIAALAPALFSVGSGIAAGYGVRVFGGGATATVPFFTGTSGNIVTAPIDLTPPGQVYLTLFGTGFDAAAAFTTVATVQGVSAPVTYSGPQASSGIDQLNLILPQSLAGTGVASISVSIGGKTLNTVYVTIR
jgi:uncharacterized protein (TIGR03437 family)